MTNCKYKDNQALISSLRNGDIGAYDYLYTDYQTRLYAYSKRIVNDDMQAQDIVQESFIKLWENRNKITISPISYLFRAVYNGSINSVIHKKVIAKYDEQSLRDFYYKTIAQLPDTEVNVLNNDVDEVINKAKNALPKRCREIFDLSREEGLKNSEISEMLGLSVKSVENQMTIAISKLKKSLTSFVENRYFSIFF